MATSLRKLGFQFCKRQGAREMDMYLLLILIFVESGIQRRKIGPKLNKNIRRSAAIFADLNAGPSVVVIGL